MGTAGQVLADTDVAVVVVGGGQAGLATGYYLQRAGLRPGQDFLILDSGTTPGGAWPHMWSDLRLFSPSSFSSLPGWMMPAWDDRTRGYPPRDHVVGYLSAYEQRYQLEVRRPCHVRTVTRADADPAGPLLVAADDLTVRAGTVVSATGTWSRPFWPAYPGAGEFRGRQLHAARYRNPEDFAGQRVVIVGGGNSAAQILAEVSTAASTTWVTTRPPRFLPDDVDGRVLFDTATARIRALREGREHAGVTGLGDIVMVASVKQARDRGVLEAQPMFQRLTATGVRWVEGTHQEADAIIWCTGFRPALRHLAPLHLAHQDGHVLMDDELPTRVRDEPRLFLVGYGDWTGPASATLLGVGATARATVQAILEPAATAAQRR